MAFASSPFAQGGTANAGSGGFLGNRRDGPESPTGPNLGPGSELKRLYNMPHTMGHGGTVQCATMVDDKVYTAGRDGALLMWRGQRGSQGFELAQDGNPIVLSSNAGSILYEPTSKWLFLGCWRGEIQAFCKDPVRDCSLTGHKRSVTCLAVHSNVVISGSMDATVRLWQPNQ